MNIQKVMDNWLKLALEENQKIYFCNRALSEIILLLRLGSTEIKGDSLTLMLFDMIVRQKNGVIVEVVEIVGRDNDANEILTNIIFEIKDHKLEFSGKSYFLEKVMASRNISKEQVMELLKEKKVEVPIGGGGYLNEDDKKFKKITMEGENHGYNKQ